MAAFLSPGIQPVSVPGKSRSRIREAAPAFASEINGNQTSSCAGHYALIEDYTL